jgi:hypothetical protein
VKRPGLAGDALTDEPSLDVDQDAHESFRVIALVDGVHHGGEA